MNLCSMDTCPTEETILVRLRGGKYVNVWVHNPFNDTFDSESFNINEFHTTYLDVETNEYINREDIYGWVKPDEMA